MINAPLFTIAALLPDYCDTMVKIEDIYIHIYYVYVTYTKQTNRSGCSGKSAIQYFNIHKERHPLSF